MANQQLPIASASNATVLVTKTVNGVTSCLSQHNYDSNRSTNVLISKAFIGTISNVASANHAIFADTANEVNGYCKVMFTHQDMLKNIALLPANKVISQIDIIILEQFDNPDTTIKLGTMATPDLLANSKDCQPHVVGSYAALPGQIFLEDTWVVLTINKTNTTGKGMIVIYF